MKDLLNEKYPFKLRTVQCIDILKEQNQKRLAEAKKDCKECQYGACTNSLNEICIEHECLEQLISVYDELVHLCMDNNLLNENSRVFKVYNSQE